jgi:Fructosamine-3-kinase
MNDLFQYISRRLGERILSSRPVSGGDISSAYRIETETGKYFLKVNAQSFALEMFHAEQKGLRTIEETNTIAVPNVHLVDSLNDKAFLLMDFVESKRPDASDFQRLGRQLARLHRCTSGEFGFPSDNFIGSLSQSNQSHSNWPQFYWHERIFPQLRPAVAKGLLSREEVPAEERAITLFDGIFGTVAPSLLHGDLWGGNYLIAADGTPCLIDPATYYGHSMVDIAMSRLFGGFDADFYDAYHEIIPKGDHYQEQIELYQLYYLLVHLNLFGSGYYSGVSSILRRYF